MNNVNQFNLNTALPVASLIAWKHAEADNAPDFEAAVLLRSLVLPAFETATCWRDLAAALESIGFGLMIQNGRLVLIDNAEGLRICTGRFLGVPLADMVKRLGKPMVKATDCAAGNGVFLF